jgi:hypothetical protein
MRQQQYRLYADGNVCEQVATSVVLYCGPTGSTSWLYDPATVRPSRVVHVAVHAALLPRQSSVHDIGGVVATGIMVAISAGAASATPRLASCSVAAPSSGALPPSAEADSLAGSLVLHARAAPKGTAMTRAYIDVFMGTLLGAIGRSPLRDEAPTGCSNRLP